MTIPIRTSQTVPSLISNEDSPAVAGAVWEGNGAGGGGEVVVAPFVAESAESSWPSTPLLAYRGAGCGAITGGSGGGWCDPEGVAGTLGCSTRKVADGSPDTSRDGAVNRVISSGLASRDVAAALFWETFKRFSSCCACIHNRSNSRRNDSSR